MLDVELARQQWRDGSRRVEANRGDPAAYERLHRHVEVVRSELRRRVGQTFTLEELVGVYERADVWTQPLLYEAVPEESPPPDTATVADAAFDAYAVGATDYTP